MSSFLLSLFVSQLQKLGSGNCCAHGGSGGVNCRGGMGVNLQGGGGIAKPEGRVSLGGAPWDGKWFDFFYFEYV